MLSGTAAQVYGFDVDYLAGFAEKFGPTVADVHTPLDPADYPSDSTCNAFDRLSHRSVTDFIGVRLPSELAFTNLGDLYLVLGYGLFPVLLVLFTARAWRRKSSGRVRVMREDERPG